MSLFDSHNCNDFFLPFFLFCMYRIPSFITWMSFVNDLKTHLGRRRINCFLNEFTEFDKRRERKRAPHPQTRLFLEQQLGVLSFQLEPTVIVLVNSLQKLK